MAIINSLTDYLHEQKLWYFSSLINNKNTKNISYFSLDFVWASSAHTTWLHFQIFMYSVYNLYAHRCLWLYLVQIFLFIDLLPPCYFLMIYVFLNWNGGLFGQMKKWICVNRSAWYVFLLYAYVRWLNWWEFYLMIKFIVTVVAWLNNLSLSSCF